MAEGVPIKVKIGLRANGHADHPNWDLLPLAQDGTDPASHQIVKWHYDKQSGHGDDTPDSPLGMQWGMMVVTDQFANEAVATFPTLVTIMTEAEAQDFWENRAMAHVAESKIDASELQGLLAELELRKARGQAGPTLTDINRRIDAALDTSNPMPGVRKTDANREKTWAGAKQARGFTIKP